MPAYILNFFLGTAYMLNSSERFLVTAVAWVLFLSGLFGLAVSFADYFRGAAFQQYFLESAGSGAYLFLATVVVILKNKFG